MCKNRIYLCAAVISSTSCQRILARTTCIHWTYDVCVFTCPKTKLYKLYAHVVTERLFFSFISGNTWIIFAAFVFERFSHIPFYVFSLVRTRYNDVWSSNGHADMCFFRLRTNPEWCSQLNTRQHRTVYRLERLEKYDRRMFCCNRHSGINVSTSLREKRHLSYLIIRKRNIIDNHTN